MKFKSLLLALLFPLASFGANTNLFDNVLIRNDLQYIAGTPSAGRVLTSDAAGHAAWTLPGSTGINQVFTNSPNTFSVLSSNTWNGVSTFNGTLTATNAATFTDGVFFSQNATSNFIWECVNGTTGLGRWAVKPSGVSEVFTNSPNIFSTASSNTLNGATFFNGPIGINTNAIGSSQIVLQGNGMTNFTIRVSPSQPAGGSTFQVISAAGTQVFGVRASGQTDISSSLTIGLGSYAAASMSPSSAGADVPIINNTATANSTISLRGGSGTGSAVIFRADNNVEIARVTTNGFGIYTNSPAAALHVRGATILGPNGSIISNHCTVAAALTPGSIAAGGAFTNNFTLTGATLYSACIPRLPPGNSLSLSYQACVISNNSVTLFIINRNLVSAVTASNDTYGVTVISH